MWPSPSSPLVFDSGQLYAYKFRPSKFLRGIVMSSFLQKGQALPLGSFPSECRVLVEGKDKGEVRIPLQVT